MTGTAEALGRLHLADRVYVERDEDEEDVMTPMRPSAKALGKRRAMEADEPAGLFFLLFFSHANILTGSTHRTLRPGRHVPRFAPGRGSAV